MIYLIITLTVIFVEKLANVSPLQCHEARLTYYNTVNYTKPRIIPNGSPLDVAGLCRKSRHPPQIKGLTLKLGDYEEMQNRRKSGQK